MRLAGLLLAAYLVGSFNGAIPLLRLLGRGDPRGAFSGNPGTTNVSRLAGRGWAAAVLLFDAGRGLLVALAALSWLSAAAVPWVGLALVAGIRFPCFHGFRGGKGVAGYLGFVLGLSPAAAAAACLVWVLVHRATALPFAASLVMVLILAGGSVGALGHQAQGVAGTAATVVFIGINHRRNAALWLAERRLRRRGR